MDKGKKLNQEFNEIYDLISDVDNKIDVFYMEHFLYNIGTNFIDDFKKEMIDVN